MTTIAKRMMNDITTKAQVGTAACAIAIAAAVPMAAANADTAIPSPIAPVTQVLGSAPILGPADFALAPVDFAEQFGWFLPAPGDNDSPIEMNYFASLALAALGVVAIPTIAFFGAVANFITVLFRVGPYGTGE